MLKGVFNRILSVGLLGIFLTVLGLASFASSAHADGLDYSVSVAPSLNVTIPASSVVLNLNPNNKTFAKSDDLNIVVGTNNPTGYQLTMTSTGTSLNRDSSLDGKTATIDTLPELSGGYTESTFASNKWGYSKDNSNFLSYTPGVLVSSSNTATAATTANLSFASKIDSTQMAGSYSLTLTFNAVANQLCVTSITGTMQAFNPAELCDDVTSGTLTDARDSKSYTVAKLADGNWWMTKNLDLAGGTELYSDTSDVADGYPSSGSSYYHKLPASSTSGFNSETGEFVYNTSNRSADSYCSSSPGCYSYYSWLAATAGGKDASGTAVTGNGYNAPYSICPKGWKLPSATTSDAPASTSPNWKTGDLYKLATAYGANLKSDYYENSATFYINAGPGTTPNFLLAGQYYGSSPYSGGSFYDGGSYGRYWSSSSQSSAYAYSLTFHSSLVNLAKNDLRRYGFPVRCLLSGSSS